MELLKAIILGVIQGLTEFLPISSSGHLVLGSELLNFHGPGISFEVFLHCGTLLAVVVAFRQELLLMVRSLFLSSDERRADPAIQQAYQWNGYVILATLPAVGVGLLLKDSIDRIFATLPVTFTMLAVTGLIMALTRLMKEKGQEVTAARSLLMGAAQAMAIMPGLSRSGSTIFAGMAMGMNRTTAARFSFIMSIPAILGALVLNVRDLLDAPPSATEMTQILAGTAASAISGYLAIVLLMHVVRKGQLHWFGYYCFCVSGLGFAWYFFA